MKTGLRSKLNLRSGLYAGLLAATVALSHCPDRGLERKVADPVAVQTPAVPPQAAPRPGLDAVLDKYTLPLHVRTYLQENVPHALALEGRWGVPAAAALAKAGVETGFGRERELIDNANNHFGLKWEEQYGDKFPGRYRKGTWEDGVAGRTNIRDDFFVYPDARASYLHFGEFLATRQIGKSKPYANVMRNLDSPESFLEALADSSYSTDRNELRKTMSVLRQYHLKEIIEEARSPIR